MLDDCVGRSLEARFRRIGAKQCLPDMRAVVMKLVAAEVASINLNKIKSVQILAWGREGLTNPLTSLRSC